LLKAQRRAVGATVEAALAVAQTDLKVAFNLGGGFHHSEPETGGGFCVYNDIAVAIAKLRGLGFIKPIAIVDLDYHEGNGNVVIFANDPSVLCYSIHGARWTNRRARAYQGVLLPPGSDDSRYLQCLDNSLEKTLQRHCPAIVFYVAGNDVLSGDRLGEFRLSPAGVLARDKIVLKAVRACHSKLVVTMAGGYTSQAWKNTADFLRVLLTDEAVASKTAEPLLRVRFNEIARTIDREKNASEADDVLGFTEDDIGIGLGTLGRGRRILGHYTSQSLELILERYGIFSALRAKGFSKLRVVIDPNDPERQIVRVFDSNALLFELILRLVYLPPPEATGFDDSLRFLGVEWLRMENPEMDFSVGRPQLPGQEHPGLGLGELVQELLVQMCIKLSLDGIYSRPSHYHNAAIAGRWFRFLDPVAEGKFLALRHVLSGVRLADASELVETHVLQLRDKTPVSWFSTDQVLPVSERLTAFFESAGFVDASLEVCNNLLKNGLHVGVTKS
jgi:hypothetical protein